MNIIQWIGSLFTKPKTALALYKQGMAKAKKHDHAGAIADYTESLSMCETQTELSAMVLYNRGLVFVATGDTEQGIKDLDAVLKMDSVQEKIRSQARLKMARIAARAGGND